jgi:hypothetical protein
MIQDKYKKWSGKIRLTSLLVLLSVSGLVLTQTSSNYRLQKQLADQGGTLSMSDNYKINDAIGQPSPVGVSGSINYSVSSGFWGGGFIITYVHDPYNDAIPDKFALFQNYPNPFNPSTTISFDLPTECTVSINIYDINGRQIKTHTSSRYTAGSHQIQWDGRDDRGNPVASGIYVYRINAGKFSQSRKMMLLK